jgi:ribose transport system permease protein
VRAAYVWARQTRLLPSYLLVLAVIALLVIIGGMLTDRFLAWRNFSTLFQQMVVLGTVSLGQTVVILTGGIDLAIGSLVGADTVFLGSFLEWQPNLVILAIVIALAGSAAIGAINGLLVVLLRIHPLIVTLGTSSILLGCALLYRREPGGSVPPAFEDFAFGQMGGLPVPAIALVVLFLVAWVWLQLSPPGRRIYLVGGNAEAARLNGVPVGRVLVGVYAFSGLCGGLAAIFLTARTGVGDPRIGLALTLQSITPVIVGGTILAGGRGGVVGTLLGVFLMSLLNNLLNFMNVSSSYQWVVQGVIILAAVGLHGKRKG